MPLLLMVNSSDMLHFMLVIYPHMSEFHPVMQCLVKDLKTGGVLI